MIENGSIAEAVAIPGTISGSSIVRDLLSRIADKLNRDCSLRPLDVYSGYSYRVSVELQLHDVYPTTVTAEVAVGRIDPKLEVQQIELGSDITAAEPEASNLERPVDMAGVVAPPAPPPSLKRLVDNAPPQARDNMPNHTVPEAVTRYATPQGAQDGGMVQDVLSTGKRQYTPRGVTPGARARS
jgi:hypothetical protein